MMPDQESLCFRRALMISPLLEMHTSKRCRGLVGDSCDGHHRQHLFRFRIAPLSGRHFQWMRPGGAHLSN
jgi:hypothetical protein